MHSSKQGLFELRAPPGRLTGRLLGVATVATLGLLWFLATRGATPETRWVSPVILPSPLEVVRSADLVLVVLVPGMGDDIQAIKAGILEIADLFVVNKADRPGADRVVPDLESMLSLAPAAGAACRRRGPGA